MTYFNDGVYLFCGSLLLIAIWFFYFKRQVTCRRPGTSGESQLALITELRRMGVHPQDRQHSRGFTLYQHTRSHQFDIGAATAFCNMNFPPPPPTYAESMKLDNVRLVGQEAEETIVDVEDIGTTSVALN